VEMVLLRGGDGVFGKFDSPVIAAKLFV
jgi:hypothetical protein